LHRDGLLIDRQDPSDDVIERGSAGWSDAASEVSYDDALADCRSLWGHAPSVSCHRLDLLRGYLVATGIMGSEPSKENTS
jgi:hypothetical protein